MFTKKIAKVSKKDGRIADFNRNKLVFTIAKAAVSVKEDPKIGNKIIDEVEKLLFKKYRGRLPTTENIQNAVEDTLLASGHSNVAKAYIIYREKKYELRKVKILPNNNLNLNLNSIEVLNKRYLLKNEYGEVIETPLEMLRRVAKTISNIEKPEKRKKYESEFFSMMHNLEFLPNSPCLMNASSRIQQLSGCFVIPIPDSLDKIFDAVKTAAIIQKTGGGTGFDFSTIRQKGEIILTTKERASGPVSFMQIFDKMTEVIKNGSKRNGANMGILSIDHPDIIDFISCKNNYNSLNNFNISVAVTNKFMNAVIKNKNYDIIDPRTKQILKKENARKIFNIIINNAWNTGDPGLIFIDEINKTHNLNEKISATNPCGEQPLLPNESCVLGSINLTKFVYKNKINWKKLEKTIKTSVRFLDNVIDANDYITNELEETTKAGRKIGLGIMGWADMLIMLNIAYNSSRAVKLADKLMKFINEKARKASIYLGFEKGSFAKFKESKLASKYKFSRNASVTTIAPTGTISIIANSCSSGIEPIFAVSYYREILGETKFAEINPYFEQAAKSRGFYSREIIEKISDTGSVQNLEEVPKDIKKIFVTAHDIEPKWHIKMQAAFQKHVENGVSKTINVPSSISKSEINKAIILAYKLKCKGITIFRYGSKHGKQVLYFRNSNNYIKNGCCYNEY